MKCKKCHAKIMRGEKYCPRCGKKVTHTGRNITIGTLITSILLITTPVVMVLSGAADIPIVTSIMERFGLSSPKMENTESALSLEIDTLLENGEDLRFVSEDDEPISTLQGGELQKFIMSYISYSLHPKSVKDDSAIIEAEFVYPDLVALATDYIEDGNDPDLFATWVQDHLDEKASYLSKTVTFSMKLNDGVWEITIPAELYDILSGGMQSYIKEKNEEILNSLKEGAES